MANLLEAALWYAKRGWAVFPCKPGAKASLTEHGFEDATTNKGIIRAWWAAHPNANIGVSCGASGLAVIDVDVKGGKPGLESWRDLLQLHGQAIGETVTSETPSGGMHLIYTQNGTPIGCTVDTLAEGIDTRGTGGYIVVPPSVTPDGDYHWAMHSGPHQRALQPFPDALVPSLQRRADMPADQVTDGIKTGRRNVTLASLAGTMRRRGMSAEAITLALLAENQR